ncbi:MAG: site-specific integrase [Thaumarchaeota archaeon]|nr:site-specific integrase [Nitrososphaerota archaeon]
MTKRVVPLNIQKELGELIVTKSVETKKNYIWHFYQFMAYNHLAVDDFRHATSEQVKKWIGAYLSNISGKSVSYHKSFLASVQNVLTTFDRDGISLKRFRRGIPEEKTPEGTGTWQAHEIKDLVGLTTDKRLKACLLTMANSGVRLGALSEIRIKDVSDFKDDCKKLVVYATSSKSRYTTFVAPDGAKAIDDYLEERRSKEGKLDDTRPLFVSYVKLKDDRIISKPASKLAIKQAVRNLVETYRRKKNIVIVEGQRRYSVVMSHSFRRFFKTGLSEAKLDSTNKKRLMGHALNVDEKYDSFTEDRLHEILYEDFKKAFPYLAIYTEKYEIEKRDKKITELEEKQKEVDYMKAQIANLYELIQKKES